MTRPTSGGRAEPVPVLRPAGPSDLAAVERLLEASSLPTVGVAEALGTFVVAEGPAESGEVGESGEVVGGGEVVGVAGLEVHGEDGVLRSVAVAPAGRGRGLGRRLTERVVAEARSAGLRRLYLLTTTAEGYFPRHGFRRIERAEAAPAVLASVEFLEACPASAVAMVLDLRGDPPSPGDGRE